MLRTILLVIVLLIVIVIALVAFGVINLHQDPDGGVSIRTSDVEVGTTVKNVQVPVVRMENRTVEVPSVGVENEAPPANSQ
jgi:preprotein translocase subunit SecF